MVELIKAYADGPDTVFELSASGFSEEGAKLRAFMSLFGRRPSYVSGLKNVSSMQMDKGTLNEYRFDITVNTHEGLKSKLKMRDAILELDGML